MFHYDTVTVGELNYLYHYCSVKTLVDYILCDGRLRFSSFTETNDPKETKSWQFAIGMHRNVEDEELRTREFARIQEELSQKIKSCAKLLCFTIDHFDLAIEKDARGFDHPRMWAQYANNHSGVCLVLDKAKFDNIFQNTFADKNKFLGKVEYNYHLFNNRVQEAFMVDLRKYGDNGLDHVAQSLIQEHHDVYFFKKHPDWSAENEFRYVVFDESNKFLYCTISECLQGIIFGVDTPDYFIEIAVEKAHQLNRNVEFAQIFDLGTSSHALPLDEVMHIKKARLSLK